MRCSIVETDSQGGDGLFVTQVEQSGDEKGEHILQGSGTGDAIDMMWRLLLQRAAAVPTISEEKLYRWIKTAADYEVPGLI